MLPVKQLVIRFNGPQNGKAIPKIGLPEAPQPGDTEKLPASLRRMLALKVGPDRGSIGLEAMGKSSGPGSLWLWRGGTGWGIT